MSQPGRLRMVCSAEIFRASGVKSTLIFRIELRNASISSNRNTFGIADGARELLFIQIYLPKKVMPPVERDQATIPDQTVPSRLGNYPAEFRYCFGSYERYHTTHPPQFYRGY